MKKSACIYLHGNVQGVGMRYSVYQRATSLGLLGYVKNVIDGSVKIKVEGEETLILMLLDFAMKDVRWASVNRHKIVWGKCKNKYKLFEIKG